MAKRQRIPRVRCDGKLAGFRLSVFASYAVWSQVLRILKANAADRTAKDGMLGKVVGILLNARLLATPRSANASVTLHCWDESN